ncbi:MAG: hypothetical protein RLZZ297_561 [Chloroflexota bacterium]|jgi:predicted Zn-dependent protease
MPEPDAQALLKTANRLYREGDHARARVLLDALSDIFPDDPKIWSALATVAHDDDEMTQFLAKAAAAHRGDH